MTRHRRTLRGDLFRILKAVATGAAFTAALVLFVLFTFFIGETYGQGGAILTFIFVVASFFAWICHD
jgi:hypothetical protein